MKSLLHILLAALCACVLLGTTGCMSMPDNADMFSRSFRAEEVTVVGATPWGNQQMTAKNIEFFSDAVGLGTAAGGNNLIFQQVNPDGTPIAPAAPPAADPEPTAPPASAPAAPGTP